MTTRNALYYGDNLDILRNHIPDASIDLIYLDPPFNSNRSYNVLFKDESGREADAQLTAFDDAWHWGPAAERTYQDLISGSPMPVATMISALRQIIQPNQMLAYLVMMTARLVELHRVLKPTGSLYLHCDPTASHYLKMILDTIFSPNFFRSEIIWKRTSAHSSANRPGPIHDVILFYSKSEGYIWNNVYQPYGEEYIDSAYSLSDSDGRKWKSTDITGSGVRNGETGLTWRGINVTAKGRHWVVPPSELDKWDLEGKIHWPQKEGGMPRLKQYLDEMPGVSIQDIWLDISPIGAQAAERLGYPTQKPLELLERIIQASSNHGDVVLDPFSGCGTAIAAAQKLGRQWIGIDITHLAIAMHKARLADMYGLKPGIDYDIIGEPQDLAGAQQLAREDRYQFQWWALSLLGARPVSSPKGTGSTRTGKKGSDQGIDGIIPFVDDSTEKLKRILVQVKSGHVKSGDIRDLRGVLDREKDAPLAIFLTLEPPTSEMSKEAVTSGFYTSPLWKQDYPRIQIITIKDLLEGSLPQLPPSTSGAYKKAQRVRPPGPEQGTLGV